MIDNSIGWTMPLSKWLALNIDESEASCADILRDAEGVWIASFTKKLGGNFKSSFMEVL